MDESLVNTRMQQVLDIVINDISSIRTGRAAPSLVETLTVSVYGGSQKLKLQELATITAPDSQSLIIDPWDKSIIGEIKQGIISSNIGLNPVIDQEILRITLPPMTTEDREKYIKLLLTKLEGGKIMIRQIRGDVMHDLKRKFEAKEISEDERFSNEKRLQEITDKFVEKIDEAGDRKKQELLQI